MLREILQLKMNKRKNRKSRSIIYNFVVNSRVFSAGIDYANSRKKDFFEVKERYRTPLISKVDTPRMPWHDVAIQVSGEPVRDMARHFIQYWNFAKNDLNTIKEETLTLRPEGQQSDQYRRQGTLAKIKQKFNDFTKKFPLISPEHKEPVTYGGVDFVEEDKFHETPPRIFSSDYHSFPNSPSKENLLTPLLSHNEVNHYKSAMTLQNDQKTRQVE